MSKETIKVGDVVRLKSGGPAMTVLSVFNKGETVKCTWFDKEENVKVESFYVATLKHCEGY